MFLQQRLYVVLNRFIPYLSVWVGYHSNYDRWWYTPATFMALPIYSLWLYLHFTQE